MNNDQQDSSDPLQWAIFTGLGKASALFMSNPLPGTEQIMPTERIVKIGTDMYDAIRKLTEGNDMVATDKEAL